MPLWLKFELPHQPDGRHAAPSPLTNSIKNEILALAELAYKHRLPQDPDRDWTQHVVYELPGQDLTSTCGHVVVFYTPAQRDEHDNVIRVHKQYTIQYATAQQADVLQPYYVDSKTTDLRFLPTTFVLDSPPLGGFNKSASNSKGTRPGPY